MATPFGTMFTPNITPDDQFGIGKWTPDDFYRAMHTGRSKDGSLLYPGFPFTSYTKVTRADSDAIYAYLRSVPPVSIASRPHELRFPFNNRNLLIGWRTLFFTEGEYKPDPTSRSNGTAARISSKAWVTAPCATPRSTRWAARSTRRHSPAA